VLETLAGAVGILVVGLLLALSIRRRARLTPEQRQMKDMQRELRAVKREQRRQRFD
jgi:uncharacterized membrane protein (DUF106 family)